MRMGDLDEASHIATQFGPAAKALGEAVEKDREAAIDAIRKALREYATTAGVIVPSSAWIVAAA